MVIFTVFKTFWDCSENLSIDHAPQYFSTNSGVANKTEFIQSKNNTLHNFHKVSVKVPYAHGSPPREFIASRTAPRFNIKQPESISFLQHPFQKSTLQNTAL